MIKNFLINTLAVAIVFYILPTNVVGSTYLEKGISILVISLIIAALNMTVKPIIKIISLKTPGIKIHGESTSSTATKRLIPSGDMISLVYRSILRKKSPMRALIVEQRTKCLGTKLVVPTTTRHAKIFLCSP